MISSHSCGDSFSPSDVSTDLSSSADSLPLPSLSKILKASRISSSLSVSMSRNAMSARNSGNSIAPLESPSTSSIMARNSSSVTVCPRLSTAARSSETEMEPLPLDQKDVSPPPFSSIVKPYSALGASAIDFSIFAACMTRASIVGCKRQRVIAQLFFCYVFAGPWRQRRVALLVAYAIASFCVV